MIRVFVVGSPRSGTTLLQRLLAERLGLVTLPETHLVGRVVSPHVALRRTGWARRGAVAAAGEAVGRPVVAHPGERWRTAGVVRASARALDAMAEERGAPGWLEKTPRHLRHVALLTRACAPRFVHIVRDGAAVTASVVEVSGTHPDRWTGARDPLAAARRWAADLEEHRRWAGVAGHAFVRYEDLVADPDTWTAGLAGWLGLPTDGRARVVGPDELALPTEPWMARATEAVDPAGATQRTPSAAALRADVEVAAALDAGTAVAATLPYGRTLEHP